MKLLFFIFSLLLPIIGLMAQQRGMQPISISIEGQQKELYAQSHALVIGVSEYWYLDKLPGVNQDVEAVTQALENQGFNVVTVKNPTKAVMEKAFSDFINKYGQAKDNRLLIYYAGHGHTIPTSYGEDLGYLLPVDAPKPTRDNVTTFQDGCMEMAQIETFAKRIQSKHALFMFDACFSGSLFENTRAVPAYISFNTSKPVRQFITSGTADETVPDQSIFRQQFIEALSGEADSDKDGYITGSEIGAFLQKTVTNYSRNAQHPQYGKIRNPNLDKGDFVFMVSKAAAPTIPVKPIAKQDEIEESPIVGSIELTTEIAGSLYVDGVLKRTITANNLYTLKNQTPGTHTLKITGDQNWESTVTVLPNAVAKVGAKQKAQQEYIEMVFVKGGTFYLGNSLSENDEKPVHSVSLDDFYIGKTEVTQKQWRDIMGLDSSIFTNCDNCPVENVSWNDVQNFLQKLNQKTGKSYRLPTEAEWEFAARGGNQSKRYTYSGSNRSADVAWFIENSRSKTHQVAQLQPNELGIYDMSGNVWEWCNDWYGDYSSSSQTNPEGPSTGAGRVLRGGSWDYRAYICRSARRGGRTPESHDDNLGFRMVSPK